MALDGFYKVVSRNVSARHPFHGYYTTPDLYDYDVAAEDKLYKGVRGYGGLGLDATELWSMSRQPLLRGLLVGATAWAISKAVGADKKIARRIGLVSGGVEAIMSAGSGWLSKQIEAQLQEQVAQEQPVPQAPVPTTVVPPPKV
jgi:hypothetical protein